MLSTAILQCGRARKAQHLAEKCKQNAAARHQLQGENQAPQEQKRCRDRADISPQVHAVSASVHTLLQR